MHWWGRIAACLLAICSGRAQAQPRDPRLEGRVEAAFVGRYHWRGIRRSDVPSLQTAAALGFRLGPAWVSLGGWSSFELPRSDEQRISDLPTDDWGPSESNLWVGAEVNRPGWSLAGGAIGYRYRRHGSDPTTVELFARAELVSPVLAPRIEVWHDPGAGRGTFLELTLSRIIANPLAGPGVNLVLYGSTGYAVVPDSTARRDLPGFSETGFTHSAVGLAIRLTPRIGPLELAIDLAPELQVSYDRAAKRQCGGSDGCLHTLRPWVRLSIGMAFPARRRE